MKKIILVVLCLLLCLNLIACEPKGEVVNVFNWEDYIDPEVLDMFTQETGIKVNYLNFTLNEDMYTKVKAQPENYDVLFPSDYLIERMINEDRLEKLDFANIPNASNVLSWQKGIDYDPENAYSVPYMWGTVGILYNEEMTGGPIDSWSALWSDEYKDNVFMMDSIRDSVGTALKSCGYSLNDRTLSHLEEAKRALITQKTQGIVKAYTVDESKDKMVAGEAALALMWSGDAQYAMEKNESLRYVVPKEGSNLWFDAMVIPKGAKHKANGEKLINFLCRPDIAAMNLTYIGYSTPIDGVFDLIDEELQQSQAVFPDQEIIDRCEVMRDLGADITLWDRVWTEVKAATK